MRWFRLYASLLNNRKFQQLSESLRARLLNLWCLAAEGDGVLPTLDGIAFGLRLSEADAEDTLRQLREAGFIDDGERGLMPHDWNRHQYVSDCSTGRVTVWREKQKREDSNGGTPKKRKRNVSVTPPEQSQSRAESEQNTPPISPRSAKGSSSGSGAAGIGRNTTMPSFGAVDLEADAELKRKLVESGRVETPQDSTGSPPPRSDDAAYIAPQYATAGAVD